MTETDAISGTGSEEGPAAASRAGQPGTMDADVRAELQARAPAPGGGGLDLAHVHRLLAASPGLEGFLQDLTVKAVEAVPGTDACSLMLRRNGHPLTVASSDPLAQLLDERQYQGEFDEGMGGPCLTSVECRCEQHIRDTGEERRWNAYARFARELWDRVALMCGPETRAALFEKLMIKSPDDLRRLLIERGRERLLAHLAES